jgi:hypothetical protein
MIGTANLFSHSKVVSRIEQFAAKCNRSLTPVRRHQIVSIPAQRVDAVTRPLSVSVTSRPSVTSSNALSNGSPSTTNLNWQRKRGIWCSIRTPPAAPALGANPPAGSERTRPRSHVCCVARGGVRFPIICSQIARDFVLAGSAYSPLEHFNGFL